VVMMLYRTNDYWDKTSKASNSDCEPMDSMLNVKIDSHLSQSMSMYREMLVASMEMLPHWDNDADEDVDEDEPMKDMLTYYNWITVQAKQVSMWP
jgi:hypothetical protein